MSVDRDLEVMRDDIAALLRPDYAPPGKTPTRSTTAGALSRLRDAISLGFPSGKGEGGGKGGHSDPTAAAAGEYARPLGPDRKPIPGSRPQHKPRSASIAAHAHAELTDCLTRMKRDAKRAREIVSEWHPVGAANVEKIDPCSNPRCEHVCTGQPSSDRLRRWKGRTDPICPRCYQWCDAQAKAGVVEDQVRLWPFDARPKRRGLTDQGIEHFRDWATREGPGAA